LIDTYRRIEAKANPSVFGSIPSKKLLRFTS